MIDLSVQNIKKSFEDGKNLLDGLSFDVTAGERVGLLGRNGAGKTTLFRIIAGDLTPDEGVIAIPKSRRPGLLSQIPHFPPAYRTEDVLISAQQRLLEMKARIASLTDLMAHGATTEQLREYDVLADTFERCGGYDLDYARNKVANGLEIPQKQREQLFSTLSGGEKTRVNLARLILEDTDILLLDEPTNHLDLNACAWLEDYLKKYKGTVLVISHDRYFLDSVVTRTIEISNGKAAHYAGNYSFYVAEKARRFEEQQKIYDREQHEAARLQAAADRLAQWGTGNKNLMKKSAAIEKRIDRVLTTAKPTREKNPNARFSEKDFRGDEVLKLRGVSKRFGERDLLRNIELLIEGGERIALLGANGAGKSTLLQILLGTLRPDAGAVRLGPSVKTAFLEQAVTFAHPERTLLDTLVYADNCTPQTARNRLGAFQFTGEDVFKSVFELSGGERSRLRLCQLMQDDINFLVLDEPTNHLDIASREWIENAVDSFGGTLLFVSHDRYFISRFATRIWLLENGCVTDFKGTYEHFRAMTAQPASKPAPAAKETAKQTRKKGAPSPDKVLARLERDIASLEDQLRDLAAEKETFCTDYEKLLLLDARETALQAALDEKINAWESLAQ
ncbi:ABC-F family ATP-binding cassette domain-containing protein [Oscillospiraceae bacterium CM]|nr:ABC-F family ATP-binding cassette domain-containing protein [Oscillospiraceae bacterium CM]